MTCRKILQLAAILPFLHPSDISAMNYSSKGEFESKKTLLMLTSGQREINGHGARDINKFYSNGGACDVEDSKYIWQSQDLTGWYT